jgi:membrane protease YdiL (CAAX protease family)
VVDVLDMLVVVLTPVAFYVVCAGVPWWLGERRRRARGGAACWRSPLGVGAGLVLHLVPFLAGGAAGILVMRLGGGDPAALFADQRLGPVGQRALLLGTIAGGLAGILAVGVAYLGRGAGRVAAGLAPARGGAIVRPALLASVALMVLAIGYNVVFERLVGRPPAPVAESLVDLARGGSAWPWLPIVVLSVVVVAPLMEELVYRGVIYRAFRDRAGTGVGIAASSLLFALGHGQLDTLVVLWLFGAVLAWLYERSGSLLVPIVTHAAYNCAALVADLARSGGG